MRRATAVIFLGFSVAVACMNVAFGHYQYFVFVIPFLVACTTPDRAAKIAEFVGLAMIGLYVLLIQKEYAGMLVLYGAACLLFTAPHSTHKQSIGYMIVSTSVIAVCSYLCAGASESRLGHAFLDSMLYLVGVSTLFIMINNALDGYKSKKKTIDEKYLDLIDELQSLAHDSINLLKRITKDKDNDRP